MWRSPLLPMVAMMVVFVAIAAGVYVSSNGEPSSQTVAPQPTVSVSQERWVSLPDSAPGQPTPSLPEGAIAFPNSMGRLVAYLPSRIVTASWQTYTNDQDGYSVDYPSDWIRVQGSEAGHETITVYPPDADLQQSVPGSSRGISAGVRVDYEPPAPGNPRIANLKSITIDGVSGQLYTVSALGRSIIVAFPLQKGTLVLEADADSDSMIDVFQHMLGSLKLHKTR